MKQYGLIGFPLGHSFSKKYFEDKFEKENLQNCAFDLFPLQNIDEYTNLLATQKNLEGIAVTIPYKETVMPFLDNISPAAKEIAAVNCIKIREGKTVGFNTDVIGFQKSLVPLILPWHTHALVLGTGGASKAVQYVLQNMGISFLLVSRKKQLYHNSITYEEITNEILQKHLFIINTTPLGMTPNEDGLPNIDYEKLTKNHFLYDLIYKPNKTLFLQKGESMGCQIKNGFEMLILQAEENWKIWNE